jgi:dihydrofolate reductase
MGTIKVHEFMSLDGVIDNPSWTMEFGFDPRMGEALAGAMSGCDAILLGRTTFEMFEPAWSVRTADDDPGAPFFNDTMKYVVSSTLKETSWRNSQVLGAYDPKTIQNLKDGTRGGIYVSGSGTLVRALIKDGLVDELNLIAYPLTRGDGPKLFEGTGESKWSLAKSEAYDNGVLYLNYRKV